jgi:hypothetical protein
LRTAALEVGGKRKKFTTRFICLRQICSRHGLRPIGAYAQEGVHREMESFPLPLRNAAEEKP